MADNERFIKTYSQGNGFTSRQIVIYVDKITGVNYMFCHDGYAGGLTPLLGRDGMPIVTPINN